MYDSSMSKEIVPTNSFRDYILEKLAISGETHESLAKRIGVAKSTVSTWINEGLLPKYPTMKKVSKGLGVPLEEVINAVEGDYKPISKVQREVLEIQKKYSEDTIFALIQSFPREKLQALIDVQLGNMEGQK